MKFKDFFKDKIITTILLLLAILTIEIFLIAYPIANFIRIYIAIITLALYIIGITTEYLVKKQFYKNLIMTLEELDDKYLITEIVKSPSFIEGKILKNSLEQINKSMIENVNKYKYMLEDYKEYIELWIHEIKLPIAASKMIIENNKNEVTKNIDEEIEKIENYIEQALFYARSSNVEKDYYIRKSNLQDIVNESIKKNKNILITEKISLDIHNLEKEVNTDSKWIVFILNQIIQNSVKYIKKRTPIRNRNICKTAERKRNIIYKRQWNRNKKRRNNKSIRKRLHRNKRKRSKQKIHRNRPIPMQKIMQ